MKRSGTIRAVGLRRRAVAFAFAVVSLVQLQSEIHRSRNALKLAHVDAERRAENASREARALQAAIDEHTLCSITDPAGTIIDEQTCKGTHS